MRKLGVSAMFTRFFSNFTQTCPNMHRIKNTEGNPHWDHSAELRTVLALVLLQLLSCLLSTAWCNFAQPPG